MTDRLTPATAPSTPSAAPGLTGPRSYRLPRTVSPSRYELEWRIDPARATLDGRVEVAVTVHEPVREIVLNANCLSDIAGVVSHPDGTTIEAPTVTLDPEHERLHLQLAHELPAGTFAIRLTFKAQPLRSS